MSKKQPSYFDEDPKPAGELARSPGRPKAKEPTVRTGIGLPESTMNYIEQLAAELNVSRHSVLKFAIYHFVKEHQAGRIDMGKRVVKPRRNTLDLD